MRFTIATVILLAACSKADGGAAPPAAPAPAPAPAAAPPRTPTLSGPHGTISGKVSFDGAPPAMPELARFTDGQPRDKACATHEKANYVVVNGGGVKDTLVRIAVGQAKGPVPTQTAVIDQKNCLYQPHVLGIMAGQLVAFTTSDPTMHNVHTYNGEDTDFNEVQPPGTGAKIKDVPVPPGDADYRIKCDFHPWMEAHVVVTDHPFFVVTGDDGTFKMDVPPGHYTLEAWHPHLGTKTVNVTVKAGEAVAFQLPAYKPEDYRAPQ